MHQAISGAITDCHVEMVGDLENLRGMLRELNSVDLVLLDLSMPGASGLSGLMSIRAEFPETPVVVVSASEDGPTIRKCIDLGASGFIPKSSSTDFITQGIRAVQNGDIFFPPGIDLEGDIDSETTQLIGKLQSLTPQQARVLSMLGEGLLNKQIAYELGVSEATVKAHVSAVLLKLEVDSRTQAVIIMNRIGADLHDSTASTLA